MKKLLTLALAGTGIAGSVTACGSESATTYGPCETDTSKVVVAALPSEVVGGDIAGELLETVKIIGEALGRETEIIKTTDNDVAALAVASCRADIVVGSTGTFWEAEALNPSLEMITTTAEDGDINKAGYKAVIGTHIDNAAEWDGITDPADIIAKLKGESMSFVSNASTSGGLLPMQMFWDNTDADDYKNKSDIFTSNKYLGDVQMTGSHTTNVHNILDDVTKYGVYYEEGLTVATGSEDDPDNKYDAADMHVVYETQAPGTPMWGNLNAEDNLKLQSFLETVTPETHPGLYNVEGGVNIKDETYRFISIDKEDATYQTIKNINDANDYLR